MTPWLVVPGRWSEAEITHHARALAEGALLRRQRQRLAGRRAPRCLPGPLAAAGGGGPRGRQCWPWLLLQALCTPPYLPPHPLPRLQPRPHDLRRAALSSNCSCNCLAPKVVLLAEGWDQGGAFVAAVKEELAGMAAPAPYYAGTAGSWVRGRTAPCAQRGAVRAVGARGAGRSAARPAHRRRLVPGRCAPTARSPRRAAPALRGLAAAVPAGGSRERFQQGFECRTPGAPAGRLHSKQQRLRRARVVRVRRGAAQQPGLQLLNDPFLPSLLPACARPPQQAQAIEAKAADPGAACGPPLPYLVNELAGYPADPKSEYAFQVEPFAPGEASLPPTGRVRCWQAGLGCCCRRWRAAGSPNPCALPRPHPRPPLAPVLTFVRVPTAGASGANGANGGQPGGASLAEAFLQEAVRAANEDLWGSL